METSQILVTVEHERGRETATVGELVRVAVDSMRPDANVSPTKAHTYRGRLGIKVNWPSVGNYGSIAE